jgi:hypothetical protein
MVRRSTANQEWLRLTLEIAIVAGGRTCLASASEIRSKVDVHGRASAIDASLIDESEVRRFPASELLPKRA